MPDTEAEPTYTFVVASQMKTASQSVYASIQNAFGSERVFHTHWFADLHEEGATKSTKAYAKQVRALRALGNLDHRQVVITILRDPVDRLYSHLFHIEAQAIAQSYEAQDIGLARAALTEHADAWIAFYRDYYGREFKPLGLDALNPRQGWPRAFLVLRMHELAETFPAAMARLTGRNVPLIFKNSAEKYGTPEAYRWFKSAFQLSSEARDALYADPVTRHYYGARSDIVGQRELDMHRSA